MSPVADKLDEDLETPGARPDGPMRRCFVTRRVEHKDALIRFVVGPDNRVHPDIAAALPGRGLWLSAERDVVHTACAGNLFAKGFRAAVSVDADLADRVEALVAARCLDLLGLARRASALAAGFEKVREMLSAGRAGVFVVASDAADDGRLKLERRHGEAPVVALFLAAELARALGREHVVYVAVAPGRLATRFVAESRRLAGLRRELDEEIPGRSRAEMVRAV
ncbi:MAG: RNA-binding protein [Alphaproteobacteria bacterium]|jgi:hypothetical protein